MTSRKCSAGMTLWVRDALTSTNTVARWSPRTVRNIRRREPLRMGVLDVAAFEWAGAKELDPTRFPAADVTVIKKVRVQLE